MKIYSHFSVICVKDNKFYSFIPFKQKIWYNFKTTLNFKAI